MKSGANQSFLLGFSWVSVGFLLAFCWLFVGCYIGFFESGVALMNIMRRKSGLGDEKVLRFFNDFMLYFVAYFIGFFES